MDYLHFESEENENKYHLSIEDNDNKVQNILVGYLLDYMKKEQVTYVRDLGREIVLNHIHIDTFNITYASLLISEIHKLIEAAEDNFMKEKTESYQKFLDSSFYEDLSGILEEDSMKRAKIKKELE